MKKISILFLVCSIAVACNKSNSNGSIAIAHCNILQSLEELNESIEECNENQILSIPEIESNLVGEWVLSGIIPGWTAFEPTTKCFVLSIDKTTLTLRNMNTGEEIISTWTLNSIEVNNNLMFFLEPTNEELRWSAGMQIFSENIMYGAGFADDTDTYVYIKV